ncbi:MAG TPA: hypothetical protein VGI39_33735 [Polyangiaceae bacterium]|jgi:hypothetical protein
MRFHGWIILAATLVAGTTAARRADALAAGKMCPPKNTATDNWACGSLSLAPLVSNQVQNPQVVLIFWEDDASGPVWSQNATSKLVGPGAPPAPTFGEWIGWTLSVANSPYFAGLYQYRGPGGFINPVRVSPIATLWQGTAPKSATTASFQKQDVQDIIDTLIQNQTIPAPPANDNNLYVVIPPWGAWAQDCVKSGCNDGVRQWSNAANPWYTRIVIGNPSDGNPGRTLTHEIVEAIAWWQHAGLDGCTDNGAPKRLQIADVCCDAETQNGVSVTSYWSDQDKACVIPESWGDLWVNTNQPGSGWHMPSGDLRMRQAAGGAGGVVATGTDDNAYFYDGGRDQFTGEWTLSGRQFVWRDTPVLPGPNATYAAGGSTVAALPLDTSRGVLTYDLVTGAKSTLGMPPGALALTSLTVTSGGWVVVTDHLGNPWYWRPPVPRRVGAWVQFGGPGAQFTAMGQDIVSLQTNQHLVYKFPASFFGGATNVNGWQLLDDLSGSGRVAALAASPDVSGWFYGSWGAQFEGSSSFVSMASLMYTTGIADVAITGAANLSHIGVDFNLANVACDGGQCTTGDWRYTGGRAGRTISGSKMLVAGCDSNNDPCVYY